MGFGRSGTSLMGGILHEAGYYMGDKLYPARHSNPKGFFENAIINGINESILAPYDYCNSSPNAHIFSKEHSPFKPKKGQRWLSYLPPNIEISCNDTQLLYTVKHETSKPRFAYKDPRFSFTLPVWNKFFPKDTVYICIFREPSITVQSVITECNTAEYLNNFFINSDLALKLWYNCYKRILSYAGLYSRHKLVLVHYNQLLNGQKIETLSELLNTRLSNTFADNDLKRSKPIPIVGKPVKDIYIALCKQAGYY